VQIKDIENCEKKEKEEGKFKLNLLPIEFREAIDKRKRR